MLDKLRSLLAGGNAPDALSDMKQSEPLAVCALLLEAAEADFEVDPAEQQTIATLLSERYSLDAAAVRDLIADCRKARAAEPDMWRFTTTLARRYGPEEKEDILELVWRVILSDGRLDPYEDQLAGRLRAMLSVNHSVLMNAKQRARQAIADGTP